MSGSSADERALDGAAARLDAAASNRVPCDPIAGQFADRDVDAAYAVQQRVTALRVQRGARVIGRKIGLTSAAVQQQIGVDRPDFGVLFDDMRYGDGVMIPDSVLLQPRAEAEIAFVLGADIPDATDPHAVRAAVRTAHAAIEVVDSRIADWRIGIVDTIADNASSGVFVMAEAGLPLSEFEPVDAQMTMTRNGEPVSYGDGVACLGDPLNALAWLAATAITLGDPLKEGDIVLSGALGPMVPVSPGDEFVTTIEPLGSVTARFGQRGSGNE